MSQDPNPMRIKAMTKQKMIERNIKTADYQRELIREHLLCARVNDSSVGVFFDKKNRQYYVECSNCAVYTKETKEAK